MTEDRSKQTQPPWRGESLDDDDDDGEKREVLRRSPGRENEKKDFGRLTVKDSQAKVDLQNLPLLKEEPERGRHIAKEQHEVSQSREGRAPRRKKEKEVRRHCEM